MPHHRVSGGGYCIELDHSSWFQSVLALMQLAPAVPEASFAAAVVSQDRRETQL